MKPIRRALFVACALAVAGAADVEGQQGVESILRARERLELTEQQIEQLDAIRREAVRARTAEMAEIAELRSQLQAGQIRRSELMAAQETRRDATRARAEELRGRVDALLTDEQRESVELMRRRDGRQRRGVRPADGPRLDRGERPGPGRGGRRAFEPGPRARGPR